MRTVEIPGGTATIRENHEIRVRHEQAIEAATIAAAPAFVKIQAAGGVQTQDDTEATIATLAAAKLTVQEVEAVQALARTKILAGLVEWTLPQPLPTPETILDLDGPTYEALATATGDIDTKGKVSFDPPDPEGPEFEGSPTQPSGVSGDASRADQEAGSTLTPPGSGTSTSSDGHSQGSPTMIT